MTRFTEDLIILAVGLKPKAGPNTGVLPLQFRFGVRGGELVTLAMAGRVAVGNGRIEVRDPAPLADPALNHALSQLVTSGGADLGQWMVHLPPMHVTYYFERLRTAGALRPVQVRLLLIAKRTGYLLVDRAYFHHVRMRLHTAVTSPGPVDAAQAAWLAPRRPVPGHAALQSKTIRTAGPSSALRPAASGGPRSRRPCGPPPRPWCTRLSPRSPRRSIQPRMRARTRTPITAVDLVPLTPRRHTTTDPVARGHVGARQPPYVGGGP